MAFGRVRVGIEEDMQVIEGADQADVLGQQHAVAEDVSRHVADADAGEIGGLGVDAEFAEMALDRFPGALGGDAHLLMVIADGATTGEGVAEPEAVIDGDPVGDVGEGRRALVGGDHQIGIVGVVADHVGGWGDFAGDEIVGNVEQAAYEGFVTGHRLCHQGHAVAAGGRLLNHEAALGANRHDDRVLDHLRLHQAKHLGAEILAPVRPAQATAGDPAAA